MSASLVGSEMCIRDRYQAVPSAVFPGTIAAAPTHRPNKHLRHEPGAPVSYTHLTLPTICSV
eukprot:675912-Alexandrium_andersonii.AAC.1